LLAALDIRDTETEGHSERVAAYTMAMANRLKLAPDDLQAIELGALLHDIGKIGVPDSILYPYGLAGEAIPLGARIFAIADTLDAMTSDRPYRKALSFAQAREEIIRCSGQQFDPDMVKLFLDIPEEELRMIREISLATRQQRAAA